MSKLFNKKIVIVATVAVMLSVSGTYLVSAQQFPPDTDPFPGIGQVELGWFIDTPGSSAETPFCVTWFHSAGADPDNPGRVIPDECRTLIDPFINGPSTGRARAGALTYPVPDAWFGPWTWIVDMPNGWVPMSNPEIWELTDCTIQTNDAAKLQAFRDAQNVTVLPDGGVMISNIPNAGGESIGCNASFVNVSIPPEPDVDDDLDDIEANMQGKEQQIANLEDKVIVFDEKIADLQTQIDDENTKQQKLKGLNTQVASLTDVLAGILAQLAAL